MWVVQDFGKLNIKIVQGIPKIVQGIPKIVQGIPKMVQGMKRMGNIRLGGRGEKKR